VKEVGIHDDKNFSISGGDCLRSLNVNIKQARKRNSSLI
jgi:hypothetical protein